MHHSSIFLFINDLKVLTMFNSCRVIKDLHVLRGTHFSKLVNLIGYVCRYLAVFTIKVLSKSYNLYEVRRFIMLQKIFSSRYANIQMYTHINLLTL